VLTGWWFPVLGHSPRLQEELAAASQSSSRSMNPSGSTTSTSAAAAAAGNSTTSGGSSAANASFFYVRRHTAKFHVLSLSWDQCQGTRLLVVGYQQAQVWVINAADYTVSDRIPLQLPAAADAGEAGRIISAAQWLPGSDSWAAVTTPAGLYLYDVTHSASQPAVVVKPQGHQLLAGGAAFVQTLQQKQQGCGVAGVQQVLHCVLLTRDGQLLTAPLSQQMLAAQQSCSFHWPNISCRQDAAQGSSGGLGGPQNPGAASRTASPGPPPRSPAGSQEQQGAADAQGSVSSGSSSSSGCVVLTAEPVAWPDSLQRLQQGRSCHYSPAGQLLVVAGSSSSTGGGSSSTDDTGTPSSSSSITPVQLLLQLNSSCTAVVQGCTWDTSQATAPVFGSPKPLVLSPAALFWDVPLLLAARGHYSSPQLLVAAPGQAKQLQSSSSTGTAQGLGCAYIAAISPTQGAAAAAASGSSSGEAGWQVTTQPLHLRHSAGDACLDGLAVLSFPYTQQLLLVALCSSGNMYMYTSKRPAGLAPLQPHTHLLRQRLLQSASSSKADDSSSTAAAASSGSGGSTAAAAAAAGSDIQQPLSRRAAAAAAAGAVAQVPPDADSSQGSAAAASVKPFANPDVSIVESCQHLNNFISLSGDITRAGSPEAAARALLRTLADPERRLEAPTVSSGMKLTVKFAAGSGLVPVALRFLLPGGGSAPTSVTISAGTAGSTSGSAAGGGSAAAASSSSSAKAGSAAAATAAAAASASGFSRVVQLAVTPAAGADRASSSGYTQRWYQVVLTPNESFAVLAAAGGSAGAGTAGTSTAAGSSSSSSSAGQLVLQFAAAVDGSRRAAVCHMDVWGQPEEAVRQRADAAQQQSDDEVRVWRHFVVFLVPYVISACIRACATAYQLTYDLEQCLEAAHACSWMCATHPCVAGRPGLSLRSVDTASIQSQ
jgi:hypothetical protein